MDLLLTIGYLLGWVLSWPSMGVWMDLSSFQLLSFLSSGVLAFKSPTLGMSSLWLFSSMSSGVRSGEYPLGAKWHVQKFTD